MEQRAKSIKEISIEFGVSLDTVRRKLKHLPMHCISTGEKGKKLINPEGVVILSELFSKSSYADAYANDNFTYAENDLHKQGAGAEKIAMLEALVKSLEIDKENYRSENSDLRESLKIAQELTSQAQQLHAIAENKIKLLETPKEEGNFFQRIFKKS
jgi:arsenate reductase-like glutaredoxin family protein